MLAKTLMRPCPFGLVGVDLKVQFCILKISIEDTLVLGLLPIPAIKKILFTDQKKDIHRGQHDVDSTSLHQCLFSSHLEGQ